MTQVTFAIGEGNNPASAAAMAGKLNQAVQGFRFLRRTIYTGLSDPAIHNCISRATAVHLILVGPGAGGAGAPEAAAGQGAASSGGGSGGYAETFTTSDIIVRAPLTIHAPTGGAGGIAGANVGSPGISGADIRYPISTGELSTFIFAGSGQGGTWMFPSAVASFALGGQGGIAIRVIPFGGEDPSPILMDGESAGVGFRFDLPNLHVLSGRGGDSRFGGGGAEVATGGGSLPGNRGKSYGAGGSGAVTVGGSARAGGDGGPALVVIDEHA